MKFETCGKSSRLSQVGFISRLLLLCTTMTLLSSAKCFGQMGNIDANHISGKSFCVLRIDVKKIIGSLQESSNDFDAIAERIMDDGGIDLKNLETLTLQFGSPDNRDSESGFAATLEFSKDVDKDNFLNRITAPDSFTKTEYNGKSYLKPQSKYEPHIYFENAKKFTLATPGSITAIMDGSSEKSHIASRVKSIPPGCEFVILFNKTDDFASVAKDFVRNVEQLGLPKNVNSFLEKAKTGFLFVNLNSGNPLRLKLGFEEPGVAKSAKTALDALVEIVKTGLPNGKQFLRSEIERRKDATGAEKQEREAMESALQGIEMGAKLLAGVSTSTTDTTIELNIKHMGGLKGAADLAVKAFKMTVFDSSPYRSTEGEAPLDALPLEDTKEDKGKR